MIFRAIQQHSVGVFVSYYWVCAYSLASTSINQYPVLFLLHEFGVLCRSAQYYSIGAQPASEVFNQVDLRKGGLPMLAQTACLVRPPPLRQFHSASCANVRAVK
jgi:hypothetical protein